MKPMLAKIYGREVLSSKDYIFEPKLDGYRALCKKNKSLKFTSRNGIDLTSNFPEFKFSKLIRANSCVLDGEIVIYDEEGLPSFSLMQRKLNHNRGATFIVFDIIEKDGKDLTNFPLIERKKILQESVKEGENIQIIVYTDDGERLWERISEKNLEGVIAKNKNSKYTFGRSSEWLKIKREKSADCIIVGYTKEIRDISSLALGVYENGEILFIGKVGTGFNQEQIKYLKEILKEGNSVKNLPKLIVPVMPKFVCEVKYLEMTRDKKLRAPVFLRIREDKNIKECKLSQFK